MTNPVTIYRIFHGTGPHADSYGCIRTEATVGELRIKWAHFANGPKDESVYRMNNTYTFVKWLNDQGIKAEMIDVENIVNLDIGP